MENNYIHRINTKKDLNDNINCLIDSYSLPEVPVAFCKDTQTVNAYLNALVPLLEHLCEEVSPSDTTHRPNYSQKDALLMSEIMLYFVNTALEFIGNNSENTISLFKQVIVNSMLISDNNSAIKTSSLDTIAIILNTNKLEENEQLSTLTNIQNEYIKKASLSNLGCIYSVIANSWYNYDTLSNRHLDDKPPASRRLIFETFLNSTDDILSLNNDGSGLDTYSLQAQIDFYKYISREWSAIKPVSLSSEAIVLKKHAQLLKIINTNIDFEPSTHKKLQKLVNISGLFARDILGSTYESSIQTAEALGLEESKDFWLSVCLTASTDDYLQSSINTPSV